MSAKQIPEASSGMTKKDSRDWRRRNDVVISFAGMTGGFDSLINVVDRERRVNVTRTSLC